jgi:hypothetical protein
LLQLGLLQEILCKKFMEGFDNKEKNAIYAKSLRAGKRTYFFDVRESTRSGDFYLTITESKKRFVDDSGRFVFDKHKVFLYKEDFEQFVSELNDVMDYIKREQPFTTQGLKDEREKRRGERESTPASNFTDVSFEDLDS